MSKDYVKKKLTFSTADWPGHRPFACVGKKVKNFTALFNAVQFTLTVIKCTCNIHYLFGVIIKTIFKQAVLLCLALALAAVKGGATGLTYLVIFNGTNGSNPFPGLLLSGNTLYGEAGGNVFAINTDGTGFTNLCYSGGGYGPLALSGNVLYGTTPRGGTNHDGTVFAVNTDGTGFTNLFTFNDGIDLDEPIAGLVLSSNRLYGTTEFGDNGLGSVFAVNTDGTGFTNLYTGALGGAVCPHAGLVVSGNTLYGVSSQGGANYDGTVFAINTDGTGFTNLYSFSTGYSGKGGATFNSDGCVPLMSLLLSGNTLYGTTSQGGLQGGGTIFRINTDGTGFSNLYNFPAAYQTTYNRVNSTSSLVLSGNTLYGGAAYGTVFAISTDGTGFTNLVSYPLLIPAPVAGLVLSGHILYGTQALGYEFSGNVFALTLPPPSLNIQLTNGAIVLNWDDPTSTYSLQAAPNVDGVYTNVIGATCPYTNVITDSQMFFRLRSN
jgi:uncharacterized repeat protein (TIGR03803 family)